MSKTLILVQLQRAESEARNIARSLLSATTDFQLIQILKRAELEHGYRAKQLQRELDSVYGSDAWKEQMFAENRMVAPLAEVPAGQEALETAHACELKLNNLYGMATELVRSRVVNEAASEQQILFNQVVDMRTQKTLQIKCLPPTDVCA